MALRSSDGIKGHRPRSTLAKVMAFCLMAPGHYLKPIGFCATHLWPISQEVLKIWFHKISLKNTLVKILPHLSFAVILQCGSEHCEIRQLDRHMFDHKVTSIFVSLQFWYKCVLSVGVIKDNNMKYVNTVKPSQNGHHFADDNPKFLFLYEHF